jgi:hypothetical protein
MKIQEVLLENAERPYVCVHVKKGTYECTASSSYGAAKKAAEKWGLKSTAGIAVYLADVTHTPTNEAKNREIDDWDEDEPVADADQDKVKHLVMQLRSALDVDGNYAISFKDGSKAKLPVEDINLFLRKYETVMPANKETMQNVGGQNKEGFDKIVKFFKGQARPKSPYDNMAPSKSGGPTYYN